MQSTFVTALLLILAVFNGVAAKSEIEKGNTSSGVFSIFLAVVLIVLVIIRLGGMM